MKTAIITVILSVTIFSYSGLKAEIYSWTDEHGNTVYGDQPQPGKKTEAVELNEPTILNFPELENASDDSEEDEEQEAESYNSLNITSPADDATVRDNNGNVQISVDIQPKLFDGHTIHIYLDGKARSSTSKNSVILNNVDRGTHSVIARIKDDEGNTLIESEIRTFHLHRFFVKPGK